MKQVILSTVLAVLVTVALAQTDCSLSLGCKSCINGTNSQKCAWCPASKECLPYNPIKDISKLPGCTGTSFYSNSCIIDHKLLLILLAIAASLVAVCVGSFCIWCCCCKGRGARKKRLLREEQEWQRQQDDISDKHSAQKEERQGKLDQIRNKYGLNKTNNYQQFD